MILVTGAKGQLGNDVSAELTERDIPHIPTDVDTLDITDKKAVEDFFKDINIVNLDNTSVIVQYSIQKTNNRLLEICKVTIVCLIVFFGAGFAIMSFNEDVSTSSLFKNVYELFTGKESNGRTLIEASYSIGLGFGIIMLYGHFWKTRITNDPTPTEVEMSKYEKDINSTIISNSNKEENG